MEGRWWWWWGRGRRGDLGNVAKVSERSGSFGPVAWLG